MKSFRFRKSGKSTEKQKAVKYVGNHSFVCEKCGYTVTIPYVSDKELKDWIKDNGWKDEDGKCVCPRCIALGE